MATSSMKLEVVSTESSIFSGDVEFVIAPAAEGEIGIYPHHIPLITVLKPGVLRLKLVDNSEQVVLAVSGGFLEICNNTVTVLADLVVRSDALDEERLVAQKVEAEKLLSNVQTGTSSKEAYALLEFAIAQLKALEYLREKVK